MRKKKSHNPEEARTPNSYQRDFLLVLAAVAVLPYVYTGKGSCWCWGFPC